MATNVWDPQKSNMAAITVTPKEALVDEKVLIKITGLEQHQAVTLYAYLAHDDKVFASCASYVADDIGTVDVQKDASVQGTYTGIHCNLP